MPDYYHTAYEIGGKLPWDQLAGFLESIQGDRFGIDDWDVEPPRTVKHFLADLTPHSTLKLYRLDCAYGRAEAIEAFCERQHLWYRKTNDAAHDSNADITLFIPGKGEITLEGDLEQGPSYSLKGLKEAKAVGETLDDLIKKGDWFMQPLPPFEVESAKVST